jgi:DNA-binding transcriptional ArsR family regulator
MSSEPPARAAQPSQVRLSSQQIRVLAHPLRVRLLGALRLSGPATATSLAQKLNTNTGATSYHLRQLADVGLVAEEPERGTGRQRWWRAVHDLSSWQQSDYEGDPDARAAVEWMQSVQLRLLVEWGERWMTRQHAYSSEWRDAAGISDAALTLSPRQLRALTDELWQVLVRYRNEPPSDEPDAQMVGYVLAAFPLVEEQR